MPNPAEVATVVVNDKRFDDWESVFIQIRWTDSHPIFRFTAAERDPIPDLWGKLQWKPDDECAIYLGGILAIAGVILIRQVAYDANNHGVMLQGAGRQWYVQRGSILDEKSNYDGMTFEQVARKVIAPFGVGIEVIGALNAIPFKRLQNEPGETVWAFLERIARPRGIIIGSDHRGNVLLIGAHTGDYVDTLIEGQNILKCQCIFAVKDVYSEYPVRGQTAASDDQYGTQASEQEGHAWGSSKRYSPLLTTAEQPVWNKSELDDRARNESIWHEGTQIEANITVQGWFRRGGDLWRAGDDVYVKSPMAMLDNILKIQTVTFTQDSRSGTLTTLTLVPPWGLLDGIGFPVGPGSDQPGANPPPTSQPENPPAPATSVPDPPPEKLDGE